MKKSIIFGFVLSVVFMALSACDDTVDTSPINESPYLQLSNGSRISLNVQYIRTHYFSEAEYPQPAIVTVVSSKNEIEQYYEQHRGRIYDGNGSLLPDEIFLNAIEKYSDSYFESNFLVIVALTEVSGSITHDVEMERINEDGDIVIKRVLPELGTADMAAWSIVIELDSNYKRGQYQVLVVDQEQ